MAFFLLLASLVGALYGHANSKTGEVIMLLMCGVLIFMTVYTPIRFYKNVPSISLNNKTISIDKKETYSWNDIEKIELTGKKYFKFLLIVQDKEALTLKFTGLPELCFFDDMYANTAQIKTFINDNVLNKGIIHAINYPIKKSGYPGQITHIYSNSSLSGTVTYYKGNPFLSFDSLTKWFMILIFLVPVSQSILTNKLGLGITFLFPSLLFYVYLSAGFYYFGLSDDHLLIRNNDRFWFRAEYPLSNIREIVIDQSSSKIPIALRIITNNFENKAFPGGTLKNKHWQQLKSDLEAKGIKVRVDCYIGQDS
ncbi:hypothetical protein [Mucilaginibacter kameinonensis]|uniref:hypothetical protein n=1 Tax=Mucilaginibacter kameinonensis TaxID=452286 RepID=UPI0013CF28A7|nr:hypothetical protein [Mucilaginibacter kameinonensis]